jgi:hypothetical protein
MTAKKTAPSKAPSQAAKAPKPVALELKSGETAAKVIPVPPPARARRRPKKGKADDKAAKPERSDVDLSDVERLEGEPVVAESTPPPRPSRCA